MDWSDIYKDVKRIVAELHLQGCTTPLFRGQANRDWELLPSLARRLWLFDTQYGSTEKHIYLKFRTHGDHLIPKQLGPWDDLFLMQHHGIPTRLLDWTENFAVALYFAMPLYSDASVGAPEYGSVYILNPNRLNEVFFQRRCIQVLNHDFPDGYYHHFLADDGIYRESFPRVLAVGGSSQFARMRVQGSAYTLHNDPFEPLEALCPDAVTRVDIPAKVMSEVNFFLSLAGINKFTIFQDLDSLGEFISLNEFL